MSLKALKTYTESKIKGKIVIYLKYCNISQIQQVETKELPNIHIILKVISNSVKSSCHVLAYIMGFIAQHTKKYLVMNLGQ